MINWGRGRNVPRNTALTASLVAVTLALGGCSFVGDAGQVWGILQSEAAQKRTLAAAVSALKNIDGVESASSKFVAAGPAGDEAELHVVASASIGDAQLRVIAAIARASFGGAELESAMPTFTLRFGDDAGGGMFTQLYSKLSDDQFVAEIAHWRAAEVAIETELSLMLTPSLDSGAYERTFSAVDGADAVRTAEHVYDNFDALAAIRDETRSPTTWEFAGMRSYPNLPPADAVELFDDIRGTIALADYSDLPENPGLDFEYPEGVQLQRNKPFVDRQSVMTEVVIIQREYRDADWKRVIVAGALASGVPDLNFVYLAGEQQFLLHTSACDGTIYESSGDQKLFDAILASGAEFLPGAGPGACIPERQP